MKKPFMQFALIMVLSLSFIACGEDGGNNDDKQADGDSETADSSDNTESEPDGDLDSNENEFLEETEDENEFYGDEDADSFEFQEWTESMTGIDPSICQADAALDYHPFDPTYSPLKSGSFVIDKNFYLLTLLNELSEVRQAAAEDQTLSAVSQARGEAFSTSTCDQDISCWATVLKWSEQDINSVAAALAALPQAVSALSTHLKASGYFHRFTSQDDAELISTAWVISAEGLNVAWDDFCDDLPPADVLAAINEIRQLKSGAFLFYEPLLLTDVALMEKLSRDEAGRYEPLAEGENRAALERMAQIDWDAYPFSLMLVPGQGPDSLDVELDPNGVLRCDMAAERYLAGVTPFILTSGGHVHPDRTPYCEALEMKKYLMQTHGIPENAILVDPHARHTTTNVRNAARLILRYGFPPDKAAMTTTDMFQSIGILTMKSRLLKELGYLPYRIVKKMTAVDNCFLVSADALSADPRDPLDP